MSIGSWCASLGLLSLSAPAAAAAQSDVVVTATSEVQSDWKRADGRHVTVFSTGKAGELARVTANLERLHGVMTRIYRRGANEDVTLPLQVTLVASAERLRALNLRNLRSEEGPYAARFAGQRYYDPRPDGAVLIMARSDQSIDLNTRRRFTEECDAVLQGGDGTGLCNKDVPHVTPVARPWEAVLYSAYAQHFLLTYAPAAYPRWYLDGVGALFSTIVVHGDGAVDYATAPGGYREVFKSYGVVKVADVLAGRAPKDGRAAVEWTPYQAWLMAHFFLFADAKGEWNAPFQRYMIAVGRGEPLAQAATAFGNPARLQRDVESHIAGPRAFARADAAGTPAPDPLVTALSASAGRLVDLRLQFVARRDRDAAEAADWLSGLHAALAGQAGDADAMQLLADADCALGTPARCRVSADAVLARSPDDAHALALKGAATLATNVSAGRALLERAIDGGAGGAAALAYANSFVRGGERLPDRAMIALSGVIRAAPAAGEPRVALAAELMRQGQVDLAQRVLHPIVHGGYDSPERGQAEKLLAGG